MFDKWDDLAGYEDAYHSPDITVTVVEDGIEFIADYDPDMTPLMLADMKRHIPPTHKRWDASRKVWIVAFEYAEILSQIIKDYYSVYWPPHTWKIDQRKTETRRYFVRYIGTPKDHGDGRLRSFGMTRQDDYELIFSLDVFLDFFQIKTPAKKPSLPKNHYERLNVVPAATAADIKKSYYRLARQYHPDVCQEPWANEVFAAYAESYEILSDRIMRKRYDLSLSWGNDHDLPDPLETPADESAEFELPTRCGILVLQGYSMIGRFVVTKIVTWEPVKNDMGLTLETRWKQGKIEENWT